MATDSIYSIDTPATKHGKGSTTPWQNFQRRPAVAERCGVF